MQVEGEKVFFSYARADSEFALKLAENMRSAEVDIWIDQLDIPTGARWDQTVEDALKACPRFLIILSPASIASQNVMDEVAFAIDQNKKILPVFYRKCDIPFRLKRLQHIDFTGNYDKALTKLLFALNIQSPSPSNEKEISLPKPNFPRNVANILFAIIVLLGVLGSAFILIANKDKEGSATKFEAPVISNPRIYLLAGNKAKESLFAAYKTQLESAGYQVIGEKIMNDEGRPFQEEVRYFHAEDQAQAEKIAQVVKLNLSMPRLQANLYSDNAAKPGYIEIWFGK